MEIRLKIEDNMNKAEEIDILEKLRDTYTNHPDNYLATLFSDKFVNWASKRIRNDFPVDSMEYIKAHEQDDQKEKINKLEERLEEAQQGIIEINEVAHNATESTRYYKEEQYKLENIINEKEIKINELKNCIINLKAKLYDLLDNK